MNQNKDRHVVCIDGQKEKQVDIYIDRKIYRQMEDRQFDRKKNRWIGTQIDRQIERSIDRQIERQIDRQLESKCIGIGTSKLISPLHKESLGNTQYVQITILTQIDRQIDDRQIDINYRQQMDRQVDNIDERQIINR